jgi:type II restriction enzyme
MTLNKGEWSEVYAFLKLLADGKLYAADSDLNKLNDIYYPILKILRQESSGTFEFARNAKIQIFDKNGNKQFEIEITKFVEMSQKLLDNIKNGNSGSFKVPDIEAFMNSIKIEKLKAKSREKQDITLVVHDIFTGYSPTLGFSIKSQLGSPSTLVNSSGATNFIYKIEPPLSDEIVNNVNSITGKSKITDRITLIEQNGSNLIFNNPSSSNFKCNLIMIDSMLPTIIGEMLRLSYKPNCKKQITDLVDCLNNKNPCNFDITKNHPYYEYKIKNFLTDCALGMTPSALWNGYYDATGGYIIVKKDGDIVCYHIYNRNEFQDYLFKNTKLDTPSSSRHGFGIIYNKDGNQYFNLNLQIRFL